MRTFVDYIGMQEGCGNVASFPLYNLNAPAGGLTPGTYSEQTLRKSGLDAVYWCPVCHGAGSVQEMPCPCCEGNRILKV